MNKYLIFLMSALVFVTTSCRNHGKELKGRDDAKTTTVSVKLNPGYFSRIMMDTPYEVIFSQKDSVSVRVEGLKDNLSKVKISCSDGILTIRNKSFGNNMFSNDGSSVSIYISSPDLTDIILRGAGDFNVVSDIDTDTLNICLQGAGDIGFGNIVCDVLRAELNGSGDIGAERVKCVSAVLRLMGAGEMDFGLQNVDYTDVKLIGTGDIDIDFDHCRFAKCSLWGIGDMTLSGTLSRLDKEKRGTGRISDNGLNME